MPRLLALLALTPALVLAASENDNWPQFRGASARGVAEGHPTATTWDVPSRKGVRWKTPIPGLGHAGPVIWGDRLFVVTAVSGLEDPELKVGLYGNIEPVEDDTVHRYLVLALDKRSGEILWQKQAHAGVPKIKRHTKASHANSTPATDGRRLIAFFGSEGLYAYDLDGALLWKKNLGVLDAGFFQAPEAQWGFGSSPVLHDGKLIIQVDVQGDSYVAALDAATGDELWRTARDEVPTWGSPTLHRVGERWQILVNGWRHIGAYDLASGKEVWKMTGGGDIPIPTPFVAHDLAFFTSAHGGQAPIYAIRTSATGDLTLPADATESEHVAWSVSRKGAYMPTPLVHGDTLHVLRDRGILYGYDARTGERHYEQRLSGDSGYTASLIAADGKLYVTSENGDVHVITAGPEFERLATNDMDEICLATPAASAGVLYWRTKGHVVAIDPPQRAQRPATAPATRPAR